RAVVEEITAAGGRAVADVTDVSAFEGGEAAVGSAFDAFGRLDIVVNNAGLAGGGTITEVTEDQLDRLFAVNVVGPVATARAAWPHLAGTGRGRIVNTVSEVAFDARTSGGSI